MMDIDEVFCTLNELYAQIHGGMVSTGGALLDWAREQGLITDKERDIYYMEGQI